MSKVKYTSANPPIPWYETNSAGLTYFEKSPKYKDSFKRSMWPRNGFIDDFYWHTIGFETTNLFAFWTAVAGLSAVFQREIHVRFGDGLYPNFFIILLAPPAICRKSTALTRFDKIETTMFDKVQNDALKFRRQVPIVRGKATPEQMFASMANKKKSLSSGEELETNANLILRVSELTTLINRAQYNMTLIDKLTDFYDCKDFDTDSTIARGTTTLKNIYTTLWGATTPDALRETIPPEAFGGGFMSRCVIVEENQASRIIPRPSIPNEVPSTDEMAERLLWLMTTKIGEFTLDKEANDYYDEWYEKDIIALREKAARGESDHRDNRKSIHILKLSLILAAQRYDNDHYIHLDDLKMAIDILEYTMTSSIGTIDDISLSGKANSLTLKVRKWIKDAGEAGIPRALLMKRHNLRKVQLDQAIEDLTEAGVVEMKRVPVEKNGKVTKILHYFYKEIE